MAVKVKAEFDFKGIKKALESLGINATDILNYTMRDMTNKSRGVAQVVKGVRDIYGMSAGRVRQAYQKTVTRGSFKVGIKDVEYHF
jgi:hypothetical protein